jgi:hypothetical protein
MNEVGARAVADFDKAAALLDLPPVKANLSASSPNVPNTNFSVPVRFFKGQAGCAKLPTIIVGTGYDGMQKDLFHGSGVEILARGWNVITYEGLGQPTASPQSCVSRTSVLSRIGGTSWHPSWTT